MNRFTLLKTLALVASGLLLTAGAAPYQVATDLFQVGEPDLGLRTAPGTETFTVFAPTEGSDKFSNRVVLVPFRGRLYAQWQSSARDEDTADTWVAYAVSDDGRMWSAPRVLAPAG